jgi:hypothetical protein
MTGVPPAIFTFETTHMALWAEEVAQDEGIPHEVVPTPPGLGAGLCDLALATLADRVAPLSGALDAAGVAYRAPVGVTPPEGEGSAPP